MTRTESLDRIVSVLVLGLAIASFSLIAVRVYRAPVQADGVKKKSARRIDNWAAKSSMVVRPVIKQSGASVIVTVFTDFECPFCGRMDSLLTDYGRRNPGLMQIQTVHLPLRMHANARPASHAFECALRQGRAESFVHTLYAHQATFGSISWDSLAAIAGVSSIESFHSCMQSTIPNEVAAGERLASLIFHETLLA